MPRRQEGRHEGAQRWARDGKRLSNRTAGRGPPRRGGEGDRESGVRQPHGGGRELPVQERGSPH